ncbi:MAG: hypothetical protein PWP27_1571 [Clostridiales bacterium]|jgi:hypothetical protein|nr:hypothetical protein [Clostridiales bacterium]MDK2933761.1 hypothetical protein [Clostridiales bacterium]
MANTNPNTTKMLEYAKMRTEQCRNKVDIAISQMLKENLPVNFNSVSNRAGVSKRFLYSHKDIKEKIIKFRSSTSSICSKPTKAPLNDSSKDVIIERQKLKIHNLNEEISNLRHELQILYGKLALYQTK